MFSICSSVSQIPKFEEIAFNNVFPPNFYRSRLVVSTYKLSEHSLSTYYCKTRSHSNFSIQTSKFLFVPILTSTKIRKACCHQNIGLLYNEQAVVKALKLLVHAHAIRNMLNIRLLTSSYDPKSIVACLT